MPAAIDSSTGRVFCSCACNSRTTLPASWGLTARMISAQSAIAVRLSAPLLHAVASGFVFAIAARLYDPRVGYWAAIAYATLPGVSLSAFLISTDAVLLPCWAAALYGFIRAREAGDWRWWGATGVALGLGLLAKYAMAYWLISAFGFVLLRPSERRQTRPLTLQGEDVPAHGGTRPT